MKLTELRQNLYREIDYLIETGKPIEIFRNGHRVKIILDEPQKKLDRLRPVFTVSKKNKIRLEKYWMEEWNKEWDEFFNDLS